MLTVEPLVIFNRIGSKSHGKLLQVGLHSMPDVQLGLAREGRFDRADLKGPIRDPSCFGDLVGGGYVEDRVLFKRVVGPDFAVLST